MSNPSKPRASFKREFLTFFGSLQLAIGLLLAIAAASIIGTVLPQDQGPAVITSSSFNPALKSVLLGIQAYDVYHTFWYQFLLATLFLNLAVCTYLRFPPTWRRYQMKVPKAPPVAALQENVELGAAPEEARLDVLRKRGYRIMQDGEVVFAEKNKFVRLGPTFIHISLFAIIAGAIVGGLFGTKNSLPMQLGDTLTSQAIYDTSYVKGPLSRPPAPFKLRLDNFRMVFHPTGQVKQYYSRITFTPEGQVPEHLRIWVNEPFVYRGQYFYQSFWGIGGFTYILDGGAPMRMNLTQLKAGGYVSKPFAIGDASYVLFAKDLDQPAMLISTKTFNPEAQVVPGVTFKLHGHLFQLKTYHLFSGFQTKNDPGIPVVYFGCGVLIFGLAMVPFSHRELWIRRGEQGWVLAGRTHKGRLMLRREMDEIAAAWGTASAPSPVAAEIGATLS
ncbi:MAG TPA: cytochrome c biogenesis protein ResB [Oscillatoriaceae cyanobacterium]